MVQLVCLEGKEDPPFFFCLRSPLRPHFSIMPPVCYGKPDLKLPTLSSVLGPAPSSLKPSPDLAPLGPKRCPDPGANASALAPVTLLNNDLFQEFMRTFMERL